MALDPNGEWGLRHRVRLAYEAVHSYEVVAAFLQVDTAVVESFLTDNSYVPTGADLTAMQTNLPALELDNPTVYTPPHITERYVSTLETPIWTGALLDAVVIPPDCYRFRFRQYGPYPPYNTAWSGWYNPDQHSVADAAFIETGGDYTGILSVQFIRAPQQ